MRNLTLRNIPDGVYRILQSMAEKHGRSLNGEVLSILSDGTSLALRRLEMKRDLARFRKLRDGIAGRYPTGLDSAALIREDRESR